MKRSIWVDSQYYVDETVIYTTRNNCTVGNNIIKSETLTIITSCSEVK